MIRNPIDLPAIDIPIAKSQFWLLSRAMMKFENKII